ncbi:hypothetical protein DXG03_008124 [Asterophora parasitica]|uniref:Aminoglycoside phosphotransferase domain-containing protein n=1 Tax=Asterophora parasitica TaxID=117018 RepID=A0A9P7G1X1_9AGAR|nr:hypothetical protein DXG03_008124 [Asterophora parasitica]
MHDGFEMVARIPYPATVSKFYAIASEVATMCFLHSSGLPVPQVYDYSPTSDNAAKIEYIFMEFVRGKKLSNVWLELEEPDIALVLRQLVKLESRMMSIPFPAGGSLYYTNNLEKVAGRMGFPLNNGGFCISPDVRLHMWFGRRSQLDVDRGPFVGLLDWQHALILPPFLNAGIPGRFQNYNDPVSQAVIPPSLPVNMDKLDYSKQSNVMELYYHCIVHFYYIKNTEEYNKLHHDVFLDPMSMFICHLFYHAGAPWEAETHALKTMLIEATEIWGRLTGEGVPCPIAFKPKDLHEMKELSEKLKTETWVSNEHYKMAKALAELFKLRVLTVLLKELQATTEANWFLDDMDEKDYM